jgi:hypothetical protein
MELKVLKELKEKKALLVTKDRLEIKGRKVQQVLLDSKATKVDRATRVRKVRKV